MKLYKLTDWNSCSYNGTVWGPGIEHTAPGTGRLCTGGWLHAYTDPLLAVLLNPAHAGYRSSLLWEADGDIGKTDHGLKVGCTRLKTICTVPMPVVTTEQQVRFAIFCVKAVYADTAFIRWADGWLSRQDRSRATATTAAAWSRVAGAWAAAAAAWAAVAAAEVEVEMEAWAAWVTPEAAKTAAVKAAAAAAAWAAWAVEAAAQLADLDLLALAREAVEMAH